MRAGVVAGALTMTCAAAVPASAQSDTPGTPVIRVGDRTAEAGQRVTVTGKAPAAGGRSVLLQHRTGPSDWDDAHHGRRGRGRQVPLPRRRPALWRSRAPPWGCRPTAAPHSPTPAAPPPTRRGSASAATSVSPAVTCTRYGRRRHQRARHRQARHRRAAGQAAGAPRRQLAHAGPHDDRRGRRLRAARPAALSASARVVTGSADGFDAGNHAVGRLNVYRWAHVSWYGPGLYGGHLACGGTLGAGTIGVAMTGPPNRPRVGNSRHAAAGERLAAGSRYTRNVFAPAPARSSAVTVTGRDEPFVTRHAALGALAREHRRHRDPADRRSAVPRATPGAR